jgi:biopolymer transport protein ExbD
MVDLFSLLLTFFMLTGAFRPQEAAVVDSPSSISEKSAPDNNLLTVYIDGKDRVFFNIDNGRDTSTHYRRDILNAMSMRHGLKFTMPELKLFEKAASFGMPIENLKAWINTTGEKKTAMQIGIPMDSLNNQLADWILYARQVNPLVQVAIKGDATADYKVVKKILDIMQEKNVNKFNLITNLEKVDVKPQ